MTKTQKASNYDGIAKLTDGTTVRVTERRYLVRGTGETVLVGVHSPAGWVSANRIAYITN